MTGPAIAVEGELLTGARLSELIRAICEGDDVRLAVAFWGRGASKNLFGSAERARRARILCDVTLGGTREKALIELGAPENKRLRHVRALHAKLYWSERGVVIGSANASNAAIGFDGEPAHHVELAVYHPANSAPWKAAFEWFNALYKPAPKVNDAALARARMTWRPPPPLLEPRPGSLLDAVRLNPGRFRGIGFFFEKVPLKTPEGRDARAASIAATHSSDERDIIAGCEDGDMFTGLTDAQTRDTPTHFIEFWQPAGKKLRVFGRVVEHRDRVNGTLYTSRNARAVGKQIPGGLPSLAAASRADDAAARAILNQGRWGKRFPNPDALVAALNERGPATTSLRKSAS